MKLTKSVIVCAFLALPPGIASLQVSHILTPILARGARSQTSDCGVLSCLIWALPEDLTLETEFAYGANGHIVLESGNLSFPSATSKSPATAVLVRRKINSTDGRRVGPSYTVSSKANFHDAATTSSSSHASSTSAPTVAPFHNSTTATTGPATSEASSLPTHDVSGSGSYAQPAPS
ncbi:hypothetical protein GP486_006271, partial [Trichoglossum hirsutum]